VHATSDTDTRVLHAVVAVPQIGSRSLYRLATCRADLRYGRPAAACSTSASNSMGCETVAVVVWLAAQRCPQRIAEHDPSS